VNCPNCGASNPDDLVFCRECSAPMEEKAPELEAPVLPVAAEGAVRCQACGAQNAAGTVFCSTCRRLLFAPPAGDRIAGSFQSALKPQSEQAAALAPVGHRHAQLPKRCASCGGPLHPDQSQCTRCGADATALALREDEALAMDASSPNGDDSSVWNTILSVWNRIVSVFQVIDFLRLLFSR